MRWLRELQQCLNCLKNGDDLTVQEECHTAECNECISNKAVCEHCKRAGFTHWCPALRRCDRCLEKELPCHRAVCLNITTDCQSKLKTALELLQTNQREGVSFTAAQLKGYVEPFINMPRKACCTGLAYSKESCDLYVVNSQDDGGIYIIDIAMETGEPTYVKLVSNNTTTCSRAYCLAVVYSGDVYFTDVDPRKIGRLTGGSAAEYVIGSGNGTPSDGCIVCSTNRSMC